MSASQPLDDNWLDSDFWSALLSLESRHEKAQASHHEARRQLEGVSPADAELLRAAWRNYCEVIAELDQATAELELLRTSRS